MNDGYNHEPEFVNTNTFVGIKSGYSNPSGDYNTFIGESSGYSDTTGHSNTFIGWHSGYFNTSGRANTFVGRDCGRSNTTGYFCTFVGTYSGYSNTSGNYNTFVGWGSGYSNTSGTHNTFVGQNSGRYISDGTTPNQTSSQCTYIGTSTKASADGVTNEIAIGYNTIGNGSNTVTLGNENVTDTYLRGTVSIGYDEGDYGGGFATYTPPAGRNGGMRVVADTNATTPGQRLYVYANGAWHYVDLT